MICTGDLQGFVTLDLLTLQTGASACPQLGTRPANKQENAQILNVLFSAESMRNRQLISILSGTKVYYKLIVLYGTCKKKSKISKIFRTETVP